MPSFKRILIEVFGDKLADLLLNLTLVLAFGSMVCEYVNNLGKEKPIKNDKKSK